MGMAATAEYIRSKKLNSGSDVHKVHAACVACVGCVARASGGHASSENSHYKIESKSPFSQKCSNKLIF